MDFAKSQSRNAQAVARDVVGLQGVGCRVRPHMPPTESHGENKVSETAIRLDAFKGEQVKVADASVRCFLFGYFAGIVSCVVLAVPLALWIRG